MDNGLDQLAQSAWLATIPYLKDAKVVPPAPAQQLADQLANQIRAAGRKSTNVEDKRDGPPTGAGQK